MYYFKNRKELIEIYSFIFSICLLVPFGLPAASLTNPDLPLAVFWVALIAGVALGASGLFARDHDSGRLELYQLLSCGLEAVVLAKWVAFWLLILLPLALLVPVWGTLLHMAAAQWLRLLIGLGAGSASISILGCLAAGLLGGQGRGAALLTLLVAPLTVPLMIFGTAYCRDAQLWNSNLLFLGGFVFFMLPAMCLAVASSIRASN